MKTLLLFLAFLLLAGCGQDTNSPAGPVQPEGPADSTRSAAFADTSLEAAVRDALKKPAGPLTQEDLLSLTTLSAQGRGIVDLRGIEQLDSLTVLDLSDNRIADILPLARLTRLKFLDLTSNQVQDLSPLGGLHSLKSLVLDNNQIQDLGPLGALEDLKNLEVSGNPLDETSRDIYLASLQKRGVQVTYRTYSGGATPVNNPEEFTIAFIGETRGLHSDVYLLGSDGTPPVNLTNHPADYSYLAWSPDGSRLAFIANREMQDYPGVYVMDVDGSNVVLLTQRLGDYRSLSWSPDGTAIAFLKWFTSGTVRNYVYAEVMRIDAGGGEPADLTRTADEGTYNAEPAWSPDGTRIAFSRSRRDPTTGEQHSFEIYVINADGSNPVRLGQGSAPSWSPDGSRLLFVSDRDGGADIYVMDREGKQAVNLTSDPTHGGSGYWSNSNPAWSPDGRKVAFVSNRNHSLELYVMDADGNNLILLTQTGSRGFYTYPLWSPDGSRIVCGYEKSIYVISVGGGDPVNLTNQSPALIQLNMAIKR